MNLFGLFKRREALAPATAPVARERLQSLLAHERKAPGQPNLLGALKDDIIRAISGNVQINPEAVKVKIDKTKAHTVLRIAVNLPF